MRIAYLAHQDVRGRFGGSEVYARALARAAAAARHEVLVLACGETAGEPLEWFKEDGISYALLNGADLPDPTARFRLRETYDNPRALRLMVQALEKFSPEHLHVHHFLMTSARLVDWAVWRSIPVTATLHDYWAFCHRLTWQLPDGRACPGPQGGLRCRYCGKPEYNRWPGCLIQPAHALGFVRRNALLRRAYRQMRAVFVPSRFVLDVHCSFGFAQANLVHLHYGLPAVDRKPRPAPHAPLVAGYLGRLAPEKGVDTLIAAAKLGRGFVLHIHGHGEIGYVEELKRQAEGAPVVFAGSFDHRELDRVLDQVDVVAVPSRWRENLPLAALEAAARGVPVAVSALGGLLEAAELCGAATAAPDDPAAWAGLLTGLAANPDDWRTRQNAVKYDRYIGDDLAAHLALGVGGERLFHRYSGS